ncbi:MAG: hypothetical protein NWR87_01665 [Rhodospirillales bacterium]|jgi:hypothetical protein|nr:hypothetical protein [Rhodospirillales bacterium]
MIIKPSTLFLIMMVAAVSISLFVVKYRVQDLDEHYRSLSREIVVTRENIHVLKSEWAHLNQPDRLRALAGKFLEVGPLDANRVGDADHILDGLPNRAIEPVDAVKSDSLKAPRSVEEAAR